VTTPATRLGRDCGRLWLVSGVALVVDSGDRGRQRLARRPLDVGIGTTRLELVEQLEDACSALGGVIELDMEVWDPLQPQRPAELVPHERHRPAQGRDCFRTLPRLADHAHPYLGMAQIGRRLDLRDGGEPHPGIRHLTTHDPPDLLPEKLIDAIRPLRHGTYEPPCRSAGRRGEGATEHRSERTSLYVSECAEVATNATAITVSGPG
jgi:hypothetical protein